MRRRQLHQRCRRRLALIHIPMPFAIDQLCRDVATRRRRPVMVHAVASGAGPCGLWVATESVDHIFHEADTSPLHRDHIVLHELCHLLYGHAPAPIADHEVARLLFPSLDPGLIRRVMGRSVYTTVEEQEAELLASMIRNEAHRRMPRGRGDDRGTSFAARRIESVLK